MSAILNKVITRILNTETNKRLVYRELEKQIKEKPEIERLFSKDKINSYYAHEPVRNTLEHPDLYVTQIRYYWMYKFFQQNYPDIFSPDTKILNVGDPSGNLLQVLSKDGTSVNINRECVDFICNKGIKAVLGNAENLDFDDSSFDYVFSFQCFEHIQNPVSALKEFGRVAEKKVFLSVPYVSKSIVYNINYWEKLQKESWKIEKPKQFDYHIFEFSTADLKNLLSYTNLKYENSFPINYFDNKTFMRNILNRYIKSYFNFFVLKTEKQSV
jgi:ubiquinone/menaquinone biosynthesis C-methylase UbiE